jgi:POT family proton-dependent oligopeptide transporter
MPKMKSFIMSLFLLSVFVGNAMTGLINDYIRIPETSVDKDHAEFVAPAQAVSDFYQENDKLPLELKLAKDGPHGNPITYQLLHAKAARLSSAGPDGELKTSDDINTNITVKKNKKEEEGTWLHEEKLRKGLIGGEDDASPLKISHVIGGGTKLEGASYFWFFTKLMAAVAILFVPFSFFYKERTYLQS